MIELAYTQPLALMPKTTTHASYPGERCDVVLKQTLKATKSKSGRIHVSTTVVKQDIEIKKNETTK